MQPPAIAFLHCPEVTQLDLTGPARFLSLIGNASAERIRIVAEPHGHAG
jgi:hypothetical protein